GGTQSLHTNSRDEALSLPTEDSVRIALRTQQIIAHESGVTNSIDPLAGSYLIESMTNRIEEEARAYLDKIDNLGGAVAAIEQGFIQREIQESAYSYQKAVEAGERIVVGVNKFTVENEQAPELLKVDEEVERRQVEKVRKLREARDNDKVQAALSQLRTALQGDANLMPFILDAVRAYATLGEICGVMREVFGEYKPSVIF
ncbi:MAG: methylmalonyl-CoA mutase, partial [Firmicutes bacterium]|nr:methylmalonyl-CoA mutase [Bacillota bacterium]